MWRSLPPFHKCYLLIPGLVPTSEVLRSKTMWFRDSALYSWSNNKNQHSGRYVLCAKHCHVCFTCVNLLHPHHPLLGQVVAPSPSYHLGNGAVSNLIMVLVGGRPDHEPEPPDSGIPAFHFLILLPLGIPSLTANVIPRRVPSRLVLDVAGGAGLVLTVGEVPGILATHRDRATPSSWGRKVGVGGRVRVNHKSWMMFQNRIYEIGIVYRILAMLAVTPGSL